MTKAKYLFTIEELKSYSLSEIRESFGGKTLGLFEAFQIDINIPTTWCISSKLFIEYLSYSKDFKEATSFIESKLTTAFEALPNIDYIVRSSSAFEDSTAHSYAGVFESYLDVKKQDLAKAVAKVWKSSETLKVKNYTSDTADLKMGVVLQPMIKAKISGIAFSDHPSPRNIFENNLCVIEYANTIGEDIVQGKVIPKKLIGSFSDLLSQKHPTWIYELVKSIKTLKKLHSSPVDIEFVLSEKELTIVQQRPVSKIYRSDLLDLNGYERAYKRALLSLDIEFLIHGCSLHLSDYLELSIPLNHWMVMITSSDIIQELWIHTQCNDKITQAIISCIQSDQDYLQRIQTKYLTIHNRILTYDYDALSNHNRPLQDRFTQFLEFIIPLAAHYYIPMFMIDALHILLLKEVEKIDPNHANQDIFELATLEISSLADIFNSKLFELKEQIKSLPSKFSELDQKHQSQLKEISKFFGFLKCREPYETGYTESELFHLLSSIDKPENDQTDAKNLKAKYLINSKILNLFDPFKAWLSIRNQEMEYYYFALNRCSKLFENIARALNTDSETLWSSSSKIILDSLSSQSQNLQKKTPIDNLVIYEQLGHTYMTDTIKVLKPEKKDIASIKGSKVFGSSNIRAKVFVAFSPKDIENFHFQDESYVLVTGMTTPDFIPFITKHFCAVITDEGGILCHAAILAREMQIPCLVGTSDATERLKTNDTVEINFDTETVKIL